MLVMRQTDWGTIARCFFLSAIAVLQTWPAARAFADNASAVPAPSNRIGVMMGYHGYTAPILAEALKPRGVVVDRVTGWIDTQRYPDYGVIVLDGSLQHARHEKHAFDPDDLERLSSFIDNGGTFILIRNGWWSFNTEHGRAFLERMIGTSPRKEGGPRIDFSHPWVSHLKGRDTSAWLTVRNSASMFYSRGRSLIEVMPNRTFLHHVRSGDGQMIFITWNVYSSRPPGRTRIEPERERVFNDQVRILENIAADLFPNNPPPLPERMLFDNPYELPDNLIVELPATPDPASIRSHPPTRPLPTPSDRPMADGPARFVDAQNGRDDVDGSLESPWRTVQHAVDQLEPGDTLYLRGGVYYEHIILSRSGEPGRPITVRSYPGELAVIDGGLREFNENHETAWEPVPDGAEGEFRSTALYPGLGTKPTVANLLGNFADSMIPLQGYRFLSDLRSDNPYWNIKLKMKDEQSIYCGPGIWYNPETQRIHCRLAHTQLPGLHEDNYRGETDPRRVPLVIGYAASPMRIVGVRHIRLQDLVLRGSRIAALAISAAADIELDGLTVYGGSTCVQVEYTQGLRAIHCAFRGISAPWTFRSSLKYRSMESRIFNASGWKPTSNSDFELAYCEFTDSVDGVFLGNVTNVRFHHNLLDNLTDDGLFLTATASNLGDMPGGPMLVYQNRLSRSLTMFAFGVGHGRQTTTDDGIVTGAGVWIFRNVLDFRRPVLAGQPRGADEPQELASFGRSVGDHGSPIWEPMFFYQNTIIAREPAFRSFYAHGWGGHMKETARAVLNNIIVQVERPVGSFVGSRGYALMLDGNLHWSLAEGGDLEKIHAMVNKTLRDEPLNVPAFPRKLIYPDQTDPAGPNPLADLVELASKSDPTPYRAQHDQCADPRFVRLEADWREHNDYRLRSDSPAAGAAVAIPAGWPDPLRGSGPGDVGAIPVGHDGWRVGVRGRFDGAVSP